MASTRAERGGGVGVHGGRRRCSRRHQGRVPPPDAAHLLRWRGVRAGRRGELGRDPAHPARPQGTQPTRSEERRVGREWVSTSRCRWSPLHENKKDRYTTSETNNRKKNKKLK